ncbi:hypothetical protein [Clostridium sp. D33t1_170424_F3]|uniref:hypothetical protein n=1 Tax=Clostridium sp. D33t1_170424_F3 TaxID=2787099 RepID=UPI0018AA53CB|nr:hypothetical protein [Clostridium sp. D33t1_170424_F3]
MANIIRTGGNSASVNVFCQPEEPHVKDGIWLQMPERPASFKCNMRKHFSFLGQFLGPTGYKSCLMGSETYGDTYLHYPTFLWRPFVGDNSIFFVTNEQEFDDVSQDSQRYYHIVYLYKFNMQTKKFEKQTLFNEHYSASSNYIWHCYAGANAFEYNDSFYIFAHFEYYKKKDGEIKDSDTICLAKKLDKSGNELDSSTSTTTKIPKDKFIIGCVKNTLYALEAVTWTSSSYVVSATELYKVSLDGFKTTFTKVATLPSVYASQNFISIVDDNIYFASNKTLIKYNTLTNTSTSITAPASFSVICNVEDNIFMTDISNQTKSTFLFNVNTEIFTPVVHEDSHSYFRYSMACIDKEQLLIFPPLYNRKNTSIAADENDLNVTAFELKNSPLPENTVAIEDKINYDAILYSSLDKSLNLRSWFDHVWFYKDGKYQTYPTYIGDGTQWVKIRN